MYLGKTPEQPAPHPCHYLTELWFNEDHVDLITANENSNQITYHYCRWNGNQWQILYEWTETEKSIPINVIQHSPLSLSKIAKSFGINVAEIKSDAVCLV